MHPSSTPTQTHTLRWTDPRRGTAGRSAAVYSRTPERAAEYAAQHGCATTFTSLEELAACADVDAVYVASPTSEHAKQSILLLNAGKHVLCEKPVVSHAKELEAVLAAAQASGKAFMEAMRALKTPVFEAVRAQLAELGPCRHFSGFFCQYSSRWPAYLASTASGGDGEVPNAFLPELSNGALMDLGCYAVYAAVALLGPPDSVSYAPLMLPTGVDGGGTVLLKYKEGVASLVISKCSHSWNFTELQTENGTIRINNLGEFSEAHKRKKGGEPEPLTAEKGPAGLGNIAFELAAFVQLVQSGGTEDSTLTWKLAMDVMKVLDAARDDAGIKFPADATR